jgi:hypothetical protein
VAILGVAAVASLVGVLAPAVGREAASGVEYPWLGDPVVVATPDADGTAWSAATSARVDLPERLRDRPIELRLPEDSEVDVSIFLGDHGRPDRSPAYAGSLWAGEPLPIAFYATSELWVSSPGPWLLEIVPIEPEVLGETAGGADDAVFVYRGAASTGTVTWVGEGSLYVTAHTTDGYESLASADGEGEGLRRFVWQPASFVVIEVHV